MQGRHANRGTHRPQLSCSHFVKPCIAVRNESPIILNHVRGVLVRKLRHVLDPRACVPRKIRVTSAIDMPPAEKRYNLLIIESHSIENFITDVGAKTLPSFHRATFGVQTCRSVGI